MEWITSISKNWEALQMENELYMAELTVLELVIDEGEEWHKTSKNELERI